MERKGKAFADAECLCLALFSVFVHLNLVRPHVCLGQMFHVPLNNCADRGVVFRCNLLLGDSARMGTEVLQTRSTLGPYHIHSLASSLKN